MVTGVISSVGIILRGALGATAIMMFSNGGPDIIHRSAVSKD